jgi:hypothetical protein
MNKQEQSFHREQHNKTEDNTATSKLLTMNSSTCISRHEGYRCAAVNTSLQSKN